MEQELTTQNQQNVDSNGTALLDECFNALNADQDQSISTQGLIESIFENTGTDLERNFSVELQKGIAKRILENLNTQNLTKSEKISYLANLMAEDITYSIVEPSSLISFGYDWKNGTMVSSQGDSIEKMAERSLAYDRADSEVFEGLFQMRDAFASRNGTKYAILASPQRDEEKEEESFCSGNFIYLYEFDEIGRKVKAVSIEYPGTKEGLFAFLNSLKANSLYTSKQTNEKTGINTPILFNDENKIDLKMLMSLMKNHLKEYPIVKKDVLARQLALVKDFIRYQNEFNSKKEALAIIFKNYLTQCPNLEKGIMALCHEAIKIVRGEYTISRNQPIEKIIYKEKESSPRILKRIATSLKNSQKRTIGITIQSDKSRIGSNLRKVLQITENKKRTRRGKGKKIVAKYKALEVIPLTKGIKEKKEISQFKKAHLKINKVALNNKIIKLINTQLNEKQKIVKLVANSNRIASLKNNIRLQERHQNIRLINQNKIENHKNVIGLKEHQKNIYINNVLSKNERIKELAKSFQRKIRDSKLITIKNENRSFSNVYQHHFETLQKIKILQRKYSPLLESSQIKTQRTKSNTNVKNISEIIKQPLINKENENNIYYTYTLTNSTLPNSKKFKVDKNIHADIVVRKIKNKNQSFSVLSQQNQIQKDAVLRNIISSSKTSKNASISSQHNQGQIKEILKDLYLKKQISRNLTALKRLKRSQKEIRKKHLLSRLTTSKEILKKKNISKKRIPLKNKNNIRKIRTLTEDEKIKIYLAQKRRMQNKLRNGLKELASQNEKPLLYIKNFRKKKKIEKQKIKASKEDLLAFMNFLATQFRKELFIDEWRFNDADSYEIDIFILLRQLNIDLEEIPIIIEIIRENSFLLELSSPSTHNDLLKLIIKAIKTYREAKEKLRQKQEEIEKQISMELSSRKEETDSKDQRLVSGSDIENSDG